MSNNDFVIENDVLVRYEGAGGDVVIPDGVTRIGKGAFHNCTSLTSIAIPDGVTRIGDWTFGHCPNLTSITIPDTVTSIGYYVFCSCTSLTDVYYAGSKSNWKKIDMRNNDVYLNKTKIHFAKVIDIHTNRDFVIKNGVLVKYKGKGGDVVIPEGVTSIGEKAFKKCTSLTSITIPDSVIKINWSTFSDCKALTTVLLSPEVYLLDNITLPPGCRISLLSSTLTNWIDMLRVEMERAF